MYDVFVPVPGSLAAQSLASGSAVVAPQTGDRSPSGYRHCHYEGNLYGACNLETFGERLVCAAGRAEHRYPTAAQASFPETDLILVGEYDFAAKRFTHIEDRATLEEWIDAPLTNEELSC